MLLDEQPAEVIVKQDTVGMDPQIKRADLLHLSAQDLADAPQPCCPREQRFASVQNDANRWQRVMLSMFGYPFRSPGDCVLGDDLRAAAPALVSLLIDVTMVARKVAPAAYLEHELPEGQHSSGHLTDIR
jgi:hypothetical protein